MEKWRYKVFVLVEFWYWTGGKGDKVSLRSINRTKW
jgi:hypothetical protein